MSVSVLCVCVCEWVCVCVCVCAVSCVCECACECVWVCAVSVCDWVCAVGGDVVLLYQMWRRLKLMLSMVKVLMVDLPVVPLLLQNKPPVEEQTGQASWSWATTRTGIHQLHSTHCSAGGFTAGTTLIKDMFAWFASVGTPSRRNQLHGHWHANVNHVAKVHWASDYSSYTHFGLKHTVRPFLERPVRHSGLDNFLIIVVNHWLLWTTGNLWLG